PQTAELIAGMEFINDVIETHNQKTADFGRVKKEAIEKLKLHYLSSIFDEVKHYDVDINKLTEDIKLLDSEIETIHRRISENMGKISSKHKACEDLNAKLATFLGHAELTFVPDTTKETDENG